MNILGISCHYHESAAALLVDGRVVAASAEERFSRKKHDASFPHRAIRFCLEYGNLGSKDLDWVVFYEKPFVKFQRHIEVASRYFPNSLGYFVDSMRNALTEKLWIKSVIATQLKIDPAKILFVPHHLSHVAAAFYPSPFERAAFLTLDGVGDSSTGSWGAARGNRIYPSMELLFPHSVGLLYSTFTAFLGFEVNDGEYKVMGMAGYGKPRYVHKIKKTFRQFRDGGIALNLDYFSFHTTVRRMYSDRFIREFRGLDRFDLAASIQHVTEEILFTLMTRVARETGEKNLCFGGGVALNSVVNGLITKRTPFERVCVFPAAGDDGGAVGAALYVYHHVLGNTKRHPLNGIFWGQQFNTATIQQFLNKEKILYKKFRHEELLEVIVNALVAGKVVGWFEGRSEYGPRALGHRSIFADPKDPKMKDIVNSKIKFREEFRPFAPMVLTRLAKTYFPDSDTYLSRFMLATWTALPATKRIAPAVVHVDRTSRIQITDHSLLKTFYKKTGRPILLNTSFNLKGEPIVNSPEDAYRTFTRSGIDVLVLENFVILK